MNRISIFIDGNNFYYGLKTIYGNTKNPIDFNFENFCNFLANKRKVKIKYYSLSSDETKWRTIDIYQIGDDFIIAYCHLREEERTFVISRINQAAILNESYKIPKGWTPESIVWSS